MNRSALMVGLLLIASVTTMTWFVLKTSGSEFGRRNTHPYKAAFNDATGLREKAGLVANGFDVGEVNSVDYERGKDGRYHVLVGVRVKKDYPLYTNASLAKISESFISGTNKLQIYFGAPYDSCHFDPVCGDGYVCGEQAACLRSCEVDADCGANMACGEQNLCVDAKSGQYQACNPSPNCQSGFVCEQSNRCIKSCSADVDCGSGMRCDTEVKECIYLPLEPGGMIGNVESQTSIEKLQSKLDDITTDISTVTRSLSQVLGGPSGSGSLQSILTSVERSMASIEMAAGALGNQFSANEQAIGAIIRNLKVVTENLAVATNESGSLGRSAENIAELTDRLNTVAESMQLAVAGMQQDGESSESLGDTMRKLNETMDNIASITGKVDQGEGTLGKFVNDDGIASKTEDALDSANSLLSGFSRLQTTVELRSQYEFPWDSANENQFQELTGLKNTVALRLQPRPDKYYLLEVIADPRGVATRGTTRTERYSVDSNDNTVALGDPIIVDSAETRFNQLRYSAMFAKRMGNFTGRFGIIENTGGIGINIHGLDDNLELRLDAFDFDRINFSASQRVAADGTIENTFFSPRLRSTVMVNLNENLGFQAGVDDPLNDDLRTFFVGGFLRFNDRDLKTVLPVAPSP